jgi:hypothetical protein
MNNIRMFFNRTFFMKIKKLYKQLFKWSSTEIIVISEKDISPKCPENILDLYLTRDRTPLSESTLATINIFKNVLENKDRLKKGGILNSNVLNSKILTRYQVFINFLIEHSNGNKLPSEKFIIENCIYENRLVYTERKIKEHKKEAVECGDLIKDASSGRLILKKESNY